MSTRSDRIYEFRAKAIWSVLAGLAFLLIWGLVDWYANYLNQSAAANLTLKVQAIDEFSTSSYLYTSLAYDALQPDATFEERQSYENEVFDRYRVAFHQLAFHFEMDVEEREDEYGESIEADGLAKLWIDSDSKRDDLHEDYLWMGANRGIGPLKKILKDVESSKSYKFQDLKKRWHLTGGGSNNDDLRLKFSFGQMDLDLKIANKKDAAVGNSPIKRMDLIHAGDKVEEELEKLCREIEPDTEIAGSKLLRALSLTERTANSITSADWKNKRKEVKAANRKLTSACRQHLADLRVEYFWFVVRYVIRGLFVLLIVALLMYRYLLFGIWPSFQPEPTAIENVAAR